MKTTKMSPTLESQLVSTAKRLTIEINKILKELGGGAGPLIAGSIKVLIKPDLPLAAIIFVDNNRVESRYLSGGERRAVEAAMIVGSLLVQAVDMARKTSPSSFALSREQVHRIETQKSIPSLVTVAKLLAGGSDNVDERLYKIVIIDKPFDGKNKK